MNISDYINPNSAKRNKSSFKVVGIRVIDHAMTNEEIRESHKEWCKSFAGERN